MDTTILQLDSRVFRLVYFRVKETGDLESVELGTSAVHLGDSIRETGYIGRRAWIEALAIASELVDAARERIPNAHLVVLASETVASAENAEGFFTALRRRTGVAPEVLLPAEVVSLITRPNAPERRSPSVFPVPL
ncbi:MAG TPA: hypothetical protein VHE30_00110 [Polyangiaceae bacterium]|nr:hypothetical protein [Polyangiaceae bacterium]